MDFVGFGGLFLGLGDADFCIGAAAGESADFDSLHSEPTSMPSSMGSSTDKNDALMSVGLIDVADPTVTTGAMSGDGTGELETSIGQEAKNR